MMPPTVRALFFVALVFLACNVHGIKNNRKYLQKLFNCIPCDVRACDFPAGSCELVLETGICGCCPVCARLEGELCGLTRGRCGAGHQCLPGPQEIHPLLALLQGRARCVQDTKIKMFYQK